MVKRLRSSPALAPALVVLVLSSCADGSDEFGDGGGAVDSRPAGDTAINRDIFVSVAGTDATSDTADCVPFSPPIPCAQGTACPGDSYCDLTQTPPRCTKYHCQVNGTACDTTGGNEGRLCMSGLCLGGVCTSPVGEGSSCTGQVCEDGLLCLGSPPVCTRPRPIGSPCQDDSWCANSPKPGTVSDSPDAAYCLAGACSLSPCNTTAANPACGYGGACDPGYSCMGASVLSAGLCVQLYCGQDGFPCTSDTHCVSGFGCISDRCRELNVPLHCAGTPTVADCSDSIGQYAIMTIPGCTVVVSSCSGTAFGCATHNGALPSDCTAQAGCQWDDSARQCMGTPAPCSELTGSAAGCVALHGCTPTLTAVGSPTPCSQLSTADCTSQPGCEVTDVGVN